MSANDLLGWGAAALVFSTFCARRMTLLRMLAIASNIGFMAYGYLDHLWPIVALHVAMLPLNVVRLREVLQATAEVQDAGIRPMGALTRPPVREHRRTVTQAPFSARAS